MRTHKLVATAALAFSVMLGVTVPSSADAVIKVSLWDKADMMGKMNMGRSMGLGMGPGMHKKMGMGPMGINVDAATAAAGKVTFEVTNDSKETIHEMIVAPIENVDVVLPYNANENRVDEEAAHDLGEVAELEPGKSGSLTLELKPGLYVLYCNIPGHFMGGMWTTLTVK
jgi:uncharacterized cupredoxin-like copper-binding protein